MIFAHDIHLGAVWYLQSDPQANGLEYSFSASEELKNAR